MDIHQLDALNAALLGATASAHVKRKGGSLLATTSPRTGARIEQALSDAIDVPAYVYCWSQSGGEDNPLIGLLSLADDIIVTSDSASLICDAMMAEKPIWLFDTPTKPRRLLDKYLHNHFSGIEAKESASQPLRLTQRWLRALGNAGVVNPPTRYGACNR